QLLQRQHSELSAPFQKLRDDIDRSTALVENLLALARLDSLNQQSLQRSNITLQSYLQELIDAHATMAQQRGINLQLHCNAEQLNINPEMMHIALRNLLDNALRYSSTNSPANSTVSIAVSKIGDMLRIAICDDGPGVDAEQRSRLSERFFRVLGSGESGNGLGLSIVRRIIELHGAKLSFGSGLHERGLGVFLDFPLHGKV
ncbi:MAG: ATP-binding protein, partial [Glaciimonas sp.]|nr:ATP-binding protein [Glaciimonas sp.]